MRYLIVKHLYKGTYWTNELSKLDLIDKKDGVIDEILDMDNNTRFEPETNTWEEVKSIS